MTQAASPLKTAVCHLIDDKRLRGKMGLEHSKKCRRRGD
jgi:hypothetical protein